MTPQVAFIILTPHCDCVLPRLYTHKSMLSNSLVFPQNYYDIWTRRTSWAVAGNSTAEDEEQHSYAILKKLVSSFSFYWFYSFIANSYSFPGCAVKRLLLVWHVVKRGRQFLLWFCTCGTPGLQFDRASDPWTKLILMLNYLDSKYERQFYEGRKHFKEKKGDRKSVV